MSMRIGGSSPSRSPQAAPLGNPQRGPLLTTLDTLSSHQEVSTPSSPPHQRTSLQVICDMIECIKYFIVSKLRCCFDTILDLLFRNRSGSTTDVDENLENLDELISSDGSSTDSSALDPLREEEVQRENALYQTLRITDAERENIRFIVHTLATASPFFMPTSELRRKGEEISHVHPLRFLECILTTPDLVEDMKILKTRSFGIIWGQFTDELSEKFISINQSGMLLTHLHAFCRLVRADARRIRECILRGNFKQMAELLITASFAPTEPQDVSLQRDISAHRDPVRQRLARASLRGEAQEDTFLFSQSATGRAPAGAPASATLSASARADLDVRALPMTDSQKQKLRRILTDIASSSPVSLLFQMSSLRHDWKALKEVHPLRLLFEVFSDDASIALIGQILNHNLKKSYFLTDFALTLRNETSAEDRIPFIEHFATLMGATSAEITMNIIVGGEYNWKNVIRYIYEIKQIALGRDALNTEE